MQDWSNLSGDGLSSSKAPRQKRMGDVMTQKELILIVDDFKDDREMYAHYLSRCGFRVSLASDGQEALEKAFQLLPDLILMDLWLPQIGGWEAIRQLKADEKTKDIPIVVLTARAFVSAPAVGSEGCLIKPCQPDDLLVEVVRVLEKRKMANLAVPPAGTTPAQRGG
jgi:two-component system, cell cycle response regulator DivK